MCDKRDRTITWGWNLAEHFFKQNYGHACHTRFAVFSPLPSCSCKFTIVSARLSSPQRLLWVGRWERGEVFVFPRAAYFAFPQPLPPNLVPRFSLPVRENSGNEVASPRVGRGGRLWRPLRRSVGMCLLQYKLRQIASLLKSSFYFQWKKKQNIDLV